MKTSLQLIFSIALLCFGQNLLAQGDKLFFSEYIEGSSNNKALEIYNGGCTTINLSDYQIRVYFNGNGTAGQTLALANFNLVAGGRYVIGNSSAAAGITSVANTTNATVATFNGDDAVELRRVSTGQSLDIIGIIGVDPGTNWPVGAGATSEFTLVRKPTIHNGNTDWASSATEWDVYPQNTFTNLSLHTANDIFPSSLISGTTTLCGGGSVPLTVTMTGGTAPYTVTYNDGAGNIIENSYISGAAIPVSPASNTTYYLVSVLDVNTCTSTSVSGSATITVHPAFNIPNAASTTVTANATCESSPWTHYYDSGTNTIVLSIKKNGNNIGTIGDGTFMVQASTTPNFGTNTGTQILAPYVTNPGGWYVMNRYWRVTPTSQPATDVDVRTYFTNQDMADLNGSLNPDVTKSTLRFYKINGVGDPNPANGHAGVNAAPAYNSVGYWEYSSGASASQSNWRLDSLATEKYYAEYTIASFSGGGGGSGSGGVGAFPVEWLDFSAEVVNNEVALGWIVAQEQGNDFFTVMRSSDAFTWEKVTNVDSKGNHEEAVLYQSTDKNPHSGLSYYKIGQTDLDGKESYSRIQAVLVEESNLFSIFPNPNNGNFTLNIQGNLFNGELMVLDAIGRVVYSEKMTDFAGKKELNLEGLTQGVYHLNLRTQDGYNRVMKMVVE